MKKAIFIISILFTLSSCQDYSSDPAIIISAEKAQSKEDKRIVYEIWGFPCNHKFMSYSVFNIGDTIKMTK